MPNTPPGDAGPHISKMGEAAQSGGSSSGKRRQEDENQEDPKKRRAMEKDETKQSLASSIENDGLKQPSGVESESVAKGDTGDADDDDDKLDDRLTFPERLMYLLQHNVQPNALWWQKDGVSFGFEPKLFTEKVLNKLFPTKIKFESYIRKLNRWGFRRVPGQGLPPNGAAYKHPLFKRDQPELMKSMKFGQKADSRRPSQQESKSFLEPSSGSLAGLQAAPAIPQPPSFHFPTLAATQGLQSSQHLALLQTLADSQQRQQQQQQQQLARAFDHLDNQNVARGSFNVGGAESIDSHLRDRLLLMGLPAPMPPLQLPPPVHQNLQNMSNFSRRGFSISGQVPISSLSSSDLQRQNALLYGPSFSAGGQNLLSTSSASQRWDSSLASNANAMALDTSRRPSSSGTSLLSNPNFEAARILLGDGITSAGFASRQQPQNPAHHSSLLPAENAALRSSLLPAREFSSQVRMQPQQSYGLSRAELLFLLQEQERQQRQNEQNHG